MNIGGGIRQKRPGMNIAGGIKQKRPGMSQAPTTLETGEKPVKQAKRGI